MIRTVAEMRSDGTTLQELRDCIDHCEGQIKAAGSATATSRMVVGEWSEVRAAFLAELHLLAAADGVPAYPGLCDVMADEDYVKVLTFDRIQAAE